MFKDDPLSSRYGSRKARAFEDAQVKAQLRLSTEGYPVDEVFEVTQLLVAQRVLTTCGTTQYKIAKAILDGKAPLKGYEPVLRQAPPDRRDRVGAQRSLFRSYFAFLTGSLRRAQFARH